MFLYVNCFLIGIEIVYLLFLYIKIIGSLCILVKFVFLWKLFWFEEFFLNVMNVIKFFFFIFLVNVILIVCGICVVIGDEFVII